jgi:hypothetical protein
MQDQPYTGTPPGASEQHPTTVDEAITVEEPRRRPAERTPLDRAAREAPWLSAWAALELGQIQAWKRSWRR